MNTLHDAHILRLYGGKLVTLLNGGIGVELIIELNTTSADTLRYENLCLSNGRIIPIEALAPSDSEIRDAETPAPVVDPISVIDAVSDPIPEANHEQNEVSAAE